MKKVKGLVNGFQVPELRYNIQQKKNKKKEKEGKKEIEKKKPPQNSIGILEFE